MQQIEAKHVVYVESSNPESMDDAVFIKERIHNADGTQSNNFRQIKNFKRDWYVTREEARNHKYKKESESLSKLIRRSTTQRQMLPEACKMLRSNARSMRQLARSPFLYGTDVRIETLIRDKYRKKYPEAVSANTVAVLDIETDVTGQTPLDEEKFGDIIMISLTMGSKVYTCVTKWYVGTIQNIEDKTQKAMRKYLDKHMESRGLQLHFKICNTPGHCVQWIMQQAHNLQPDVISVFNINFDLRKMLRTLKAENINPAVVFSDPRVPDEYKYFRYDEGPKTRVMESGNILNFNPWERWHTVTAPATFQWLDSMCCYAFIRKANGYESSYKLDYILEKNIGERKLKFKECDGLTDTAWHLKMQTEYKIEYIVYNIFDCIGCELLDEHTKDLALTMPELIGTSPYAIFDSTPKQLAEDLHFFFLDEKRVFCSTSDKMRVEELDNKIISKEGWIITLATHLVEDNGARILKDFPNMATMIRLYVSDLDLRSAYPWGEVCMNVSTATTERELCRIEGVDDYTRRCVGLDLTGGDINAIEYCKDIHRAPNIDVLLADFVATKNIEGMNVPTPQSLGMLH